MTKSKTMRVRVSKEMDQDIKNFCTKNHYSGRSELARVAIRNYLDKRRSKKLSLKLKL